MYTFVSFLFRIYNSFITTFYSGSFKILKNALGQFIPDRPIRHVITSTSTLLIQII